MLATEGFVLDQQRIWAPWRLEYIQRQHRPPDPATPPARWRQGADHNCFVCRAAAEYDNPPLARRHHLVVEFNASCICLLNRYPYNNGHLLACPTRHVAQLADLTANEHVAIMQALARYTTWFARRLSADGFNVGLNLGSAAGAGVPGHLHWHLVPRWNGDQNFMPVTGATHVLSQSLESLWDALDAESRAASPGDTSDAADESSP